jgi:tripartite-type tricarboxylate transporter receptor subunit TctC
MPRRRTLLMAALATPALAQSWPVRPLRMIVSFPPGGSTDVVARLIAPTLERVLGQAVVIENRGGANGALGAAAAAQGPADGYTWLLDAGGSVTNQFLMRGLGFEYERAFAPVTQLTLLPSVLMVRADSPHNTLPRLVAHLRANPGRESYGSSGTGTGAHLSGALLMRRAGTEAQHVPYRGGAQQMTAMLSGETLFTFSTLAVPAPLLAEGRLTAIAASSAERIPGYENVGTVAEQGFPGFDMVDFHQISAPTGTPPAMIARMAEAAAEAMHSTALAQRFQLLGLIPRAQGPEAFATFLTQQRQRMGEVIRAEGLAA